jgi:dTDP-4-dehydrorhamnose 3,5-epimerase
VVLSDSADLLYKATDYYAPQFERSIAWNDPTIGIAWPLAAHGIAGPLLSDRDRAGVPLAQAELT